MSAEPSITMLPTAQLVSFQNIRAVRDIAPLADSIARVGILEPLIVTPDTDASAKGERWVIVAGNRRHAAAKKAGVDVVPCIIRTDIGSEVRFMETQLAENLQRDPLTVKEETVAFEKLALAGMSTTDIGKVSGRKKAAVDARLKLLTLPETTRAKVWDGQISLDEADELAKHADDPEAVAWLEKFVGSPSFAWQKNHWKYEKERRAKAAQQRAEKAAEKARLKAEADAARKAGTPVPKAKAEPKAKRSEWQIAEDRRKAREAAIQPIIDASAETRTPWIRDAVQRAAKSTIKLDPLQRGLLQAAADTLLNTTILDWDWDHIARDWLDVDKDAKYTDIATLTDGQLLVLAALASTMLYDPLNFPNDWCNPVHGHGAVVTRQLVQFLDYPISPEEQALADGTALDSQADDDEVAS